MNDQQFIERVHANPHDDSEEFLQAAAGNPERQRLLDEIKKLDAGIGSTLKSVTAPDGLKQTLLAIPETSRPEAANDSFWRRNLKYAAGLLIAAAAIAVIAYRGRSDPLEAMVFNHMYSEIDWLDMNTTASLDDLNHAMIASVGREFRDTSEMENLHINVTKDCWVDFKKGIKGAHFVMKGDVGPLTVMVIPNTPVKKEMEISDGRFEGVISPTPGGNLVVVGEKDESIQQYSRLLAANIDW